MEDLTANKLRLKLDNGDEIEAPASFIIIRSGFLDNAKSIILKNGNILSVRGWLYRQLPDPENGRIL